MAELQLSLQYWNVDILVLWRDCNTLIRIYSKVSTTRNMSVVWWLRQAVNWSVSLGFEHHFCWKFFCPSNLIKPCSHWLRQWQQKTGLHWTFCKCSPGDLWQRQHQPLGSDTIHSFLCRCHSQYERAFRRKNVEKISSVSRFIEDSTIASSFLYLLSEVKIFVTTWEIFSTVIHRHTSTVQSLSNLYCPHPKDDGRLCFHRRVSVYFSGEESTHIWLTGGGYPHPSWWGDLSFPTGEWYPHPSQWGYPILPDGGYLHPSWWVPPSFPMGVPCPRSGQGVPWGIS